jgi:hypothetical protein
VHVERTKCFVSSIKTGTQASEKTKQYTCFANSYIVLNTRRRFEVEVNEVRRAEPTCDEVDELRRGASMWTDLHRGDPVSSGLCTSYPATVHWMISTAIHAVGEPRSLLDLDDFPAIDPQMTGGVSI